MDLTTLLADPNARTILHERARALAGRDRSADVATGELTLRFTLGDEQYALPATAAREVLRFETVAPLPAVHPAILGLVNVRGRLLACLDLRPLLGLPATKPHPAMRLLIVSAAGIEAALLVEQVLSIQPEPITLHLTPAAVAGHSASWVRGVDDRLALHLDPEGLLCDPRLTATE
ncbi:chemotaxis protein CheW [Chloroflexus sp.]|uniref:chemotaxis protein CheW n=1 Tax=Chloroflexus sp. TaxID=1904827 RepID=UPI002ACD959D|nr:chemotaxis protein CheW [Chloroflexus sp.]